MSSKTCLGSASLGFCLGPESRDLPGTLSASLGFEPCVAYGLDLVLREGEAFALDDREEEEDDAGEDGRLVRGRVKWAG